MTLRTLDFYSYFARHPSSQTHKTHTPKPFGIIYVDITPLVDNIVTTSVKKFYWFDWLMQVRTKRVTLIIKEDQQMAVNAESEQHWTDKVSELKANNSSANSDHYRPALAEVLEYRNVAVIDRFVQLHEISRSEASLLFEDLKMWLWLANENAFDKKLDKLVIDQQLLPIDEMWHNFILFTYDYACFCRDFFGRFLHHSPTASEERRKIKRQMKGLSPEEIIARRINEKRPQYEYVFDKLGELVFKRWYVEYPKKAEFFAKNSK